MATGSFANVSTCAFLGQSKKQRPNLAKCAIEI